MKERIELFQYYQDTILIESLVQKEFGLTKKAGLFDELNLSSAADSIKNFAKEHVNPNAPGGYVGGILNLMAPSILFRAHPLIGILYLIASQFGFDFQGLIGKIMEMIKPKLEQGQQITPGEIAEAGKNAIFSMTGAPLTASTDMFEPIRKYAGPFDNIPSTPFLFGDSGGGLIQRIFGQLFSSPRGKSKATWLLGGFVIWIIKTILAGAGMLAGAEAISKALGHKSPTHEYQESKPTEEIQSSPIKEEQKQELAQTENKPLLESILQSRQDDKEIWVVPIIGGNISNTLKSWIEEYYPQKMSDSNFKEKLESNSNYKAILSQLSDPKKSSEKYLVVPKQFSSRKQIADLAIKGIE